MLIEGLMKRNYFENLQQCLIPHYNTRCHALLLVGGFARSEYLKQVQDQISARIRVIARPLGAITGMMDCPVL